MHLRGAELGCKSHGTKHTERVIAICRVRVQGSADYTCREVLDSAERIYQCAEITLLEAECHGIDSEIPSFLVVLQGSVLDDRLSRITMIGLFPRAHELYLNAMILQHGRAEILEDGDAAAMFFSFLDMVCNSSRKRNTASFYHYVNVIIRSAKEAIAHVTAYDKSPYTNTLCYFRDDAENRRIQKSLSHRHI